MERVATAMSESSSIHSDRFYSLAREFSEMGLDSAHRRLEDPTCYIEHRPEVSGTLLLGEKGTRYRNKQCHRYVL